jgi:hypothetical protein
LGDGAGEGDGVGVGAAGEGDSIGDDAGDVRVGESAGLDLATATL